MTIRHALLAGPLGFGAAPLGNMFREIPDDEAEATVDAAWQAGTRYFDTAPFYGSGLSEIRLGKALSKYPRDAYRLSTKVGRIVLDEVETGARDQGEKGEIFKYGRPNKVVYDYTADGAKRSIEDSLKRMGVDRLDFVWVHDLARDFHGDKWIGLFEQARTGAFRTLDRLRDEGVVKAWGLGVNNVEPVELLLSLDEARPDGTLLAGGTHFEYGSVPPEIAAKVETIKGLCGRHGVPIKAAALHFSLAHPASAAVIPGASRPERIAEDHSAINVEVPVEFWRDLRRSGVVAPNAPLPSGQ